MNDNEAQAWRAKFRRDLQAYDVTGRSMVDMWNMISLVEDIIKEDLRPRLLWPESRKHGGKGQRYGDIVRGYRLAITGWLWERPCNSWEHLWIGAGAATLQTLADMQQDERLDLYRRAYGYLPPEVQQLLATMEVQGVNLLPEHA
jgi:hypothetical protein